MTTQTKVLPALFAFLLSTLAACNNGDKERESNKEQIIKKPKRQDTYDAHGCLTSAGYLWSDAKDTCVRLWESATELQAVNGTEFVLYALTSDDKMTAEIFVPEDSSFLLQGKGNDVYTNDSLTLFVKGTNFVLRMNDKAIYQTAVPESVAEKPKRRKGRKR